MEIFSGSGRLARAVSAAGWQVLCWDILKGPDYDLTLPKVQNRLRGWLSSGAIRAFHMGFPCSSWSRARDQPNGPPRLRSQHHIWGLPDLAPHDLGKVNDGNVILNFVVRFCRIAIRREIPWTIENPAQSYAWSAPTMVQLLANHRGEDNWRLVSSGTVEYCSFGTPWRKSTTFKAFKVDLTWMENYRCTGGRCRFTGKKHQVLSGKIKGTFLTSRAEAYPRKLCRLLAQAFISAEAKRKSSVISRPLLQHI